MIECYLKLLEDLFRASLVLGSDSDEEISFSFLFYGQHHLCNEELFHYADGSQLFEEEFDEAIAHASNVYIPDFMYWMFALRAESKLKIM